VVAEVDAARLLRWRASEGWGPLCRALQETVPEEPFPWVNRREDWG
jgi:sulfotransferase family protein